MGLTISFRPRTFLAIVCVAVAAFAVADVAYAQQPTGRSSYKVGDKIEVLWAGKVYPGKVTAVNRNGFVTVNYQWNGRPYTESYSVNSDRLRKAGTTVNQAGGTPAAPGGVAAMGTVKETPARTWSDATGKFKIEASFAGKDDAGVKLKKADGQVLTVPLEKLSKEDQAFVAGLMAAGVGSAPAEENPFATAEQVADVNSAKSDTSAADRRANWFQAKSIVVQPVQNAALAPDAGTPLPSPAGNQVAMLVQAVGGSSRDTFFESPKSVLFDRASGEAIVVFVNEPPGGRREIRLMRCDMKTMKMTGEEIVEIGANPVDVSPSGKLIACLPDWHAHGAIKDRIEILKRDEKGLSLYRRWNMGESHEWDKRFDALLFVDDERLLTVGRWGGVAALWDIDKAQAVWKLKIKQHTTPALSANRKYMAAMTDSGIGIFDPATGATLGGFAVEGGDHGSLSFSPDGKQIACISPHALKVWDLAQGTLTREMWFPQQMTAESIGWVGGNFFLVDDIWLIDMEKRIVLWEYELPPLRGESVAAVTGGRAWVLGGGIGTPYQLASLAVPDAAAKQKASELTIEAVLAVRPGARVTLNINLPGATDEEVQKVTKAMTDQVKANGMIVTADSPLVLEATILDAGSETKTYSRFGFGGGGEEVTVNKQRSVLSLAENGKVLWATSGTFGHAPGMVRTRDGQSAQEAVDSGNKSNPVNFFYSAKFPKYLARHHENVAYGRSQLTPD